MKERQREWLLAAAAIPLFVVFAVLYVVGFGLAGLLWDAFWMAVMIAAQWFFGG